MYDLDLGESLREEQGSHKKAECADGTAGCASGHPDTSPPARVAAEGVVPATLTANLTANLVRNVGATR